VGGLRHVAAAHPLPVRLAEMGASAGLNLRADAFRVLAADGSAAGPADSPVVLRDAWRGRLPPAVEFRVVDRLGGDLAPIDPATRAGRLRLMSFVWPDDRLRLDRLRGALEVAEQIPATLMRASAADFVRRLEPRAGTVLVLWHSIMWQYLDRRERAEVKDHIARLGAAATERAPVAHLAFEPERRKRRAEAARRAREEASATMSPALDAELVFAVRLTIWPGGEDRVLGIAPPHGIPVTWRR
jgi:hypothetical protein